MSDRNELTHPHAVYANDYVTVLGDGMHFEGVILGLDAEVHEALVHEYQDGRPTDRMHEVHLNCLTHHESGRNQ